MRRSYTVGSSRWPLADALADLPPVGAWVEDGACGDMAEVFTGERRPRADVLAEAQAVCAGCLVLVDCGSYAASTVVYGLWAGVHDGRGTRRQAA